jgi:hypothetical protein
MTQEQITLLDHFAGLAMQGLIAGDQIHKSDGREAWFQNGAKASYEMAQAMLQERERILNEKKGE